MLLCKGVEEVVNDTGASPNASPKETPASGETLGSHLCMWTPLRSHIPADQRHIITIIVWLTTAVTKGSITPVLYNLLSVNIPALKEDFTQKWFSASLALQWMGAVRIRADKNITVMHSTPVHQLINILSWNKSIINTFFNSNTSPESIITLPDKRCSGLNQERNLHRSKPRYTNMWETASIIIDYGIIFWRNTFKPVLLCSWCCFGGALEHALVLGGSKITLFLT